MNIAVAGTGYVGLSMSVLLAQHNKVTAVDIVPEKVDQINHRKSPIRDEYIEQYLAEKKLDLTQFDFGDIVECEFRAPEFMGDFPKLIDVQVKFGAPYIDILKRFNNEESEE